MSTTEVPRQTSAPATETARTAPNRSIEIDGATLVYRRFGNPETDAPPLLLLQHFRGNIDNWDPALVDRLAYDREVILLDNRGVGASTGAVPDNVEDMARDILRFADALELRQVDLLGFSLGGYIAQELALVRPRLIRRIVLAGTAPKGAPRIHRWSDDVYALATPDAPNPDGFLRLFSRDRRRAGRRAWSTSGGSQPGRPIATRRSTSLRATRSSKRSRGGGSRIPRSSRGWLRSPSRRWSPTATTTR
jgi:pimeloyl-ACP methyl ester carboxylesterase